MASIPTTREEKTPRAKAARSSTGMPSRSSRRSWNTPAPAVTGIPSRKT